MLQKKTFFIQNIVFKHFMDIHLFCFYDWITNLARLSKISVTFKTQDGVNSESLNKLILNKIIVPCDIYRSQP